MALVSLDYDVIIAGFGPVGAVAANLAGAAGFKTLVVERNTAAYDKPRAIVFDAEIMRVFASIGLADAITAATRPLGGSVYLGADRQPIRTFRAPAPAHDGAWHPSNLFYQPELEAILRGGVDRFANVMVRQAHEVVAIEAGGEGTRVTVAPTGVDARDTITTRFLLACDGASSTIRKGLGIALDDVGFEERWLVVDTFVDGPMRWPGTYGVPPEVRDGRYSLMVCDPERPATLIPGVGRHRRWEYMLLPGEHSGDVVPEDWLRERLAEWVDPAQVEVVRSAVYRFRALIAGRWRERGVFLVGDAAHQTPPFFGQGMCHGIRDAAQLMWKLAMVRDGHAPDAMLDSYQVEREPHVRAIVAASVAAGAAVCTLDPTEAAARDDEFRRLEAERGGKPVAMTDVVPPIMDGIVDPLTGGMRLPEFAITDPIDAVRRLDEHLGGRFALLSLGDADVALSDAARSIGLAPLAIDPTKDEGGRLAAWLGACGARWAIVRPDRYVHSIAADRGALNGRIDQLLAQLRVTDLVPSLESLS